MSWKEEHRKSEDSAAQAEAAMRRGERTRALLLYAQAADAEDSALATVEPTKVRTVGICAVSTVSLRYKAEQYQQAEATAYKWLATAGLPDFAVEQLRRLLEVIWTESSRTRPEPRLAPDRVAMPPELSIVIPVYNEADSLGPLWRELVEVMPSLAESVEVIFVDDGSTDGSAEILQGLVKDDHRVRLIRFEANAGLSASFYAGLQATRGRTVATMDSDLQSDPRDIPMLMKYLDDADAVVGWRQVRHDSWLKRASSRIANAIRKAVSGDRVQDSACSLRVMRRECVTAVPPFTGMHRFMPTLLKISGFRVVQVRVNHRPRRFGRSKFGVTDRAFAALADLLVVRWMMHRRLRYRTAESIHFTDGDDR